MVVDDHSLVRSGLVQLLSAEEGIEIVAGVKGGREAVETVVVGRQGALGAHCAFGIWHANLGSRNRSSQS